MSFMSDIGSFFAGGADDAAVKAGELKSQGYQRAADAIMEGKNEALGYAGDATARFQPIYNVGTTALAKLANLYGLNGAGASQTAMGDFVNSPGYQFRVDEGTKALDRGAASKGGIYSGAAGKALVRYGQNVGSDEYGKWVGGIQNLAGYATPAASGQAQTDLAKSSITTNAASGKAAALIGQNDALAGGEIGRANAVTGGINSALKLGGMLVSMATGMPVGLGTTGTGASGVGSFLSSAGSNPFNADGTRNTLAYG